MPHLNVEIKARCADLDTARAKLRALDAREVGTDHQIDTYFEVPKGRLKLREGTIENALIHYHRPNDAGPKRSEVTLHQGASGTTLGAALRAALDVSTVVDKRREIYFIENVKFHLDTVEGLGTFLEIEAIDFEGDLGAAHLETQCRHFMEVLSVADSALEPRSYSDLRMDAESPQPAS